MATGALLLAIAAFFCTALGVLLTPIPWVGAVFAFAAPALAIGGIVAGGRAITANKLKDPQSSGGLALAGVVASAIALVPAVITALTCGTCNALCATGNVQSRNGVYTLGNPQSLRDLMQGQGLDGGTALPPFPTQPAPQNAPDPGAGSRDGGVAAPAPMLPPPPLAPGPAR